MVNLEGCWASGAARNYVSPVPGDRAAVTVDHIAPMVDHALAVSFKAPRLCFLFHGHWKTTILLSFIRFQRVFTLSTHILYHFTLILSQKLLWPRQGRRQALALPRKKRKASGQQSTPQGIISEEEKFRSSCQTAIKRVVRTSSSHRWPHCWKIAIRKQSFYMPRQLWPWKTSMSMSENDVSVSSTPICLLSMIPSRLSNPVFLELT